MNLNFTQRKKFRLDNCPDVNIFKRIISRSLVVIS